MKKEITDKIFEFRATPYREIFYSEETSWGTYKVEADTKLPSFVENSGKNSFASTTYTQNGYAGSITGRMQKLTLGVEYKIAGIYTHHSKYGGSIQPITVIPDMPKTFETSKKFLESLITDKQAETLLTKYPNLVNDIANGVDNIDVDTLKGITQEKYDKIKDKVVENFMLADVLAYLSPLGVTFNMVKKLANNEPNPYLLQQKLKENPYVLTQVEGLGFTKVDTLALQINPDLLSSKFRAIAYIKYYLATMGDDSGHEWIDNAVLRDSFMSNVIECEDYYDEIIQQQRENSTFLHIEKEQIGLKSRYLVEEGIANALFNISQTPSNKVITEENIQRGIAKANAFQGFTYDSDQENTIREAVKEKITVIHGKAGSSKTSTARGILNVLADAGCSVKACALSAKAGIVIQESTGFEASTIHRLFGMRGFENDKKADKTVFTDVLLTDEASMTNASLFNHMLNHILPSTIVLIVGDDKQLPSIGYGSILRDLISIGKNKLFNLITLKKIYRQALASGIIKDANVIRDNKMPFEKFQKVMVSGELKDMFYMFMSDKQDIHKEALKKYYSAIEKDGLDNVTMISPMKEGVNGVNTFNTEIQEHLLPHEPYVTCGDKKFRLGAKVMQIKNNYDTNIMNGDTGVITHIDEDKGTCTVDFGEGVAIRYSKGELNQLQLAYVLSTHKVQGQNIPVCIMVMDRSHYVLLDSCLLYTGITRASKRCLLISDTFAFKRCIQTNNQIDRNTYLKRIIKRKLKELDNSKEK